jgi:Tol biopolymer transport system component
MPDGREIVYASMDPEVGRASLYVTSLDGGPPRRLAVAPENDLGYSGPAISKDGKWLAWTLNYERAKHKLFARRILPGGQFAGEELAVSPVGAVSSAAWAPDSSRLLYTLDSAVYSWRPNRPPVRLYVGADLAGTAMGWTREGKLRLLNAQADYMEMRQVALQPGGLATAGQPAPFLPANAAQSMQEISPDGKFVVFASARTGQYEIWRADISGEHLTQLTHVRGPTAGFARWAHDSKRIAFHNWMGPRPILMVVDAFDNNPPRAITDDSVGYFAPTWSGDDQYLYADRTVVGRMTRVPLNGDQAQGLFDGVSSKISPDGSRIYYGKINHPGLFVRSMAGDPASNPEEKIVDDYITPGDDLNIFPDGIYYISYEAATRPRFIRFHSFAQHKSTDILQVRNLNTRRTRGLTVSPDRRRMIYAELTGRGGDISMIDFQ